MEPDLRKRPHRLARAAHAAAAEFLLAEQRCAADTEQAGRTGLSRVLSVAITVSQDSDTPEHTAEFLADTGTFHVNVSGWLDLLNRAREQRSGLSATFGD